MTAELSSVSPEKIHIESIFSRLRENGKFRIDIQDGLSFVCDGINCKISRKIPGCESKREAKEYNISLGLNYLDEFNAVILLSYDKSEVFSSNVYNFSTQQAIPNDIIIGKIKVREKQSGDSYRFGGMTRKLKKLFCDKKIPTDKRNCIPIICDDKGILYAEGFPMREHAKTSSSDYLYLSIYYKTKNTLDGGKDTDR